MLIESVLLKNKLIENAMNSTVSLDWVFHIIKEIEDEKVK